MATSTSLHLPLTSSRLPPSPFLLPRRRLHHLRLLLLRPPPPLSLPSPHLPLVSIATVEHAPYPEFDFSGEISRLDSLRLKLRESRSLDEKLRVLDSDSSVRDFVRRRKGWAYRVLKGLGKAEAVLVKALVAAGQGHVIGVGEVHVRGGEEESGLMRAMFALGDVVEGWSLEWNGGGGRESGGRGEMRMLLKTLGEIEEFYDCIGGIIGYVCFAPNYACNFVFFGKCCRNS